MITSRCVAALTLAGAAASSALGAEGAFTDRLAGAACDAKDRLAETTWHTADRLRSATGDASAWVVGAARSAFDATTEAAANASARARGALRDARADLLGAEVDTRPATLLIGRSLPSGGVLWEAAGAGERFPAHAVVLVHGLDESGFVWDDLAPALAEAGLTSVRFDYANDQPIATTADQLAHALRELRGRGVSSVDMVGHSMGGLVARDVLTRPAFYASRAEGPADLPRVRRLVSLGAPHRGAPLAYLQFVTEAEEHLSKNLAGLGTEASGWLHSYADGRGEAGRDLVPGSAFLRNLNGRPPLEGVEVTNVVGSLLTEATREQAVGWTTAAVSDLVGPATAARLGRCLESAIDFAGDGLVPRPSACAIGCGETVTVAGDHRSMIKGWDTAGGVAGTIDRPRLTPPAVPVVVDRLTRP